MPFEHESSRTELSVGLLHNQKGNGCKMQCGNSVRSQMLIETGVGMIFGLLPVISLSPVADGHSSLPHVRAQIPL